MKGMKGKTSHLLAIWPCCWDVIMLAQCWRNLIGCYFLFFFFCVVTWLLLIKVQWRSISVPCLNYPLKYFTDPDLLWSRLNCTVTLLVVKCPYFIVLIVSFGDFVIEDFCSHVSVCPPCIVVLFKNANQIMKEKNGSCIAQQRRRCFCAWRLPSILKWN